MAYDNIEKLGALLGDKEVRALLKAVTASDRQIAELLKKLGDMEAEANRKRAEEAQKREEERAAEETARAAAQAAAQTATQTAQPAAEASGQTAQQENREKQRPAAVAEAVAPSPEEKAPVAEKVPAAPVAEKPAAAQSAPSPEATKKSVAKEQERETSPARQPKQPSARPDRPAPRDRGTGQTAQQRQDRSQRSVYRPDRPDRPDRPRQGDQSAYGARPAYGNRPQQGVRPQTGSGTRQPTAGTRQQGGARPVAGTRPAAPSGQRTFRPQSGAAPVVSQQSPRREFTAPKKPEKTYVEKRPVSKRALQKQQGASVGDFDEDKSGYRKARFAKKGVKKDVQTIKIDHAVVTSQDIPIKVLSEKIGISAVEITKRLFRNGIMKTVNESVNYDDAAFIALELGIDLEYKPEKTAEQALFEEHGADEPENTVPRAPVVTVMGHVDHGKTSLLDKIRKTNVTEGEAGGITQSIGAYTVSFGDGKKITFIDTPGHAAFTAMRARGAMVTDIVVLVVAADDGIMPQTVEAIDHALAANVPIIVAMNKMDKPQANPDKVKQGLVDHNLVPEEWGGDVIIVPVSAKTGEGIDRLLENIYLVAEMQELKANPDRKAKGVIIEAKLDKGKGPMASVLIQNGTLHTGDNLISGTTMGRVRAMIDDKGRTVKEAGPSTAVSVLGLEDVPNAGDAIFAVDQSLMKHVQEERKTKQRESMIKETTKITLDDVFAQVADGKIKDLNLIVKGDVQGSVEAVRASLEKLSNEEVRVRVIHAGAGAINESDVMLADSANAIVIGFNVRPDSKAKTLAERSKVDVRTYRIIYELIDDMEAALKGMLAPKYREIYMGKAEVKQTFNITGIGTVAGCFVTEGKLVRGGKLRIYRDDVMIVEGGVKQLKRFKDDAKEVAGGFECGCAIDGFNEIRIGDFIECYLVEEVKP